MTAALQVSLPVFKMAAVPSELPQSVTWMCSSSVCVPWLQLDDVAAAAQSIRLSAASMDNSQLAHVEWFDVLLRWSPGLGSAPPLQALLQVLKAPGFILQMAFQALRCRGVDAPETAASSFLCTPTCRLCH